MKKLKYALLLVALYALGACQSSQEERMGVLKVYNWADYIDEDVLAEFPEWYKEQQERTLKSSTKCSILMR